MLQTNDQSKGGAMEDRWPYPTSQTMQRQTGRGNKIVRPVKENVQSAPDRDSADKPADRSEAQPEPAASTSDASS